jgi:hypothetical protein
MVFVAASMTWIVLVPPLLATYTLVPSGLTTTPSGRNPTPIVAIRPPVPALITETLSSV